MTWYELWLFLHISGAIVWIGGAFSLQVFAVLHKRAPDPVVSAAFGRNVGIIASRVFLPASLLVLFTGIAMVENVSWAWSEPFIVVGLVGWAAVVVVAFGYVGRRMAAIGPRMAKEGPSPALAAELSRVVLIARVLVLALFVIVFFMVTKLGT